MVAAREVEGGTVSVIEQPPEVSDVEIAFPANVLEWMPEWEAIPDEFKRDSRFPYELDAIADDDWPMIVYCWLFRGFGDTELAFHGKDGVDPEKAFRALRAIAGSFAPKHEHKEAAMAYLMDCWLEKVTGWKTPAPEKEDGDDKPA